MKKAITNDNGEFEYIELTALEVAEIEAKRLAEIEASWLHKNRPVRAFLMDCDYVALLIDYPEFAMLRAELNIPTEAINGGNNLYFEYLNHQDQFLLEYFGGVIEYYAPL